MNREEYDQANAELEKLLLPSPAQARPAEEELPLPEGATSLDFMKAIYRDPRQPISRRMRAAQIAIAYEHPKLSATYAVDGSRNFAQQMKELATIRGRSNVLDAHRTYKEQKAPVPAPVPEVGPDGKMPSVPGFRRRL
jgi:hypothetical protein